ncbi:MAG: ABC transporter permease [Endomicrobium sp.]|jgi:lipoprotein-releasing system permease protein|nr:ABC transporter permease [Endomicrobium sp.]
MLPVEFFIAFRYLKARRSGFFSTLTTFVAVGGTALGVAVLIVALAIMNGFQNDIRNKILGVQPHIIVTKNESAFKNYLTIENKIKENKSVLYISPFICRQGIIRSFNSSVLTNILVKAVNYEEENKILNISKQIKVSNISFDNKKIGKKSIILGKELAKNIASNVGDEIVLMFSNDFVNAPKIHKFVIVAIAEFGMYDFDSFFGFIDLDEGQRLFSMWDEISGFDININNFDKAVVIASQLQDNLHYKYRVKTWIEMNKNLFSALKLERIMMFLILGLIVLIAAFNIISNILFLSVQKFKDIGIMSAMGFSKFMISKIYFYEGISIGFIGNIFGIIVGIVVSFVLKYFNIFKLPEDIYYVNKLPVMIVPSDIVIIAVSVFIITILTGIYPAYKISKLDPLKAIKYG